MVDQTYIDRAIIQGKKETISAKNLFDTYLVGDANNEDHIYRIGFYDFFLKHRQDLNKLLQWYQIPQELYYKPKLLSMNLYGTTELWLAILRANDMKNITEMHYPLMKVYQPAGLKEILKVYFKREKKM